MKRWRDKQVAIMIAIHVSMYIFSDLFNFLRQIHF